MLNDITQDVRFALRQYRRAPGFTLTALLTMTLAVGATAAMVSVLRATLLNPTPYADAARLVAVQDVNLKGYKANGLVTVARTEDLANAMAPSSSNRIFSSVAFFFYDQPSLSIDGRLPLSVSSLGASGDFFKVLQTPPVLGRWYTAADDAPGSPEVAVISYGLWQRAFAGDARVIGKPVTLSGKPTIIVGVMPQHFDYPGGTELWKPAHLTYKDFESYRGSSTRFVSVIARLNPGLSIGDAQRGLDLLAARLGQSYAATDAEWGFKLSGLRSDILGSYREGLLLLSSAVAMLLLIACANIAGLQLSRNAKRQPEMALRRALGVGTGRLLQQLMTESLLLMVAGSLLGAALCMALLRIFSASLPPALLSFANPKVDLATLAVTILVGVLAGVFCGVVPALQFGRTPELALVPSARGRVAGGTKRFDRLFAALQLSLALVLLALASSLLQNLHGLLSLRLGYEISHVLTASVHLPFGTEAAKAHRFHQQLEQSFAALPGVDSVGAIDALPLSAFMAPRTFDIEGQPPTPHQDAVTAEGRSMTPNYLATMQIPLLAGRSFTDRDEQPGAPAVVLVNQSFATKYFPHGDALGKRLVDAYRHDEIVGIVADVRGTGGELERPVQPEIDSPENGGWPDMQFVLRTSEPASALEPAMKQKLAAVDGGLALGPVTVLSTSLDRALLLPRLNTGLLTGLAGLALLLVLIGVYGVIAFSVTQRTREIGVRIALGSSRSAILTLLLRESATVLIAGLVAGTAASLLATRLLAASVSGLNTSVAETLGVAFVLLTVAVLGASLVPARRAAHIDPNQALKAE